MILSLLAPLSHLVLVTTPLSLSSCDPIPSISLCPSAPALLCSSLSPSAPTLLSLSIYLYLSSSAPLSRSLSLSLACALLSHTHSTRACFRPLSQFSRSSLSSRVLLSLTQFSRSCPSSSLSSRVPLSRSLLQYVHNTHTILAPSLSLYLI